MTLTILLRAECTTWSARRGGISSRTSRTIHCVVSIGQFLRPVCHSSSTRPARWWVGSVYGLPVVTSKLRRTRARRPCMQPWAVRLSDELMKQMRDGPPLLGGPDDAHTAETFMDDWAAMLKTRPWTRCARHASST
jgi:hypothetical protein